MDTKKIKNALDFYSLANTLKYIEIEDSKQSYAAHLYGSMILSIAMNSEFSLTVNLGKVLRMIIIDGIASIKPEALKILERFSRGEKYLKELDEYLKQTSSDSIIAKTCSELDFELHKLIINNYSLSIDELYEKAIKANILVPTTKEEYESFKEIFRFYYMNEKLKLKERSGFDKYHWNIKGDKIERVAEHVYGTVALALALDSECEFNFNIDKVIKTLCIHEVGEILIGDITPFDGITPKQKEEIEHRAIKKVIGNLLKNKIMVNLVFDFDKKDTAETKFAYYCDKLEADLQSKTYQDKGLHHSLDDQANNVVFKSPKIQRMIDDGAKTAFDIWYEWDKHIFSESPELSKILKYAKENKIAY